MSSLVLGICAALAWACHDISVRFAAQQAGILPAISAVFVMGLLLICPFAFVLGDWGTMTRESYFFSILSGILYILGGIGLYKAFAIGPVRLVAPIIGAYPILSIAWAVLNGQSITMAQGSAVAMVIIGVAIVSILSDHSESKGHQTSAILWSLIGAVGFALTFATGHLAAQDGNEILVIFITRLSASIGAILLLCCAKSPRIPPKTAWPLLGLMGALDALALGLVTFAATLERPEFAALAASIFGILTIILARLFLKEKMSLSQWGGVCICFLGIGYLAL